MVLDASMALSWLMERAARSERARAEAVLDSLAGSGAVVPALWFTEIENACLVAERRRIVKPAQTTDFLNRLSALPISVDTSSPQSRRDGILGLGRTHALSAYDATYLELSMRLGIGLATFDQGLMRAATAVGVETR